MRLGKKKKPRRKRALGIGLALAALWRAYCDVEVRIRESRASASLFYSWEDTHHEPERDAFEPHNAARVVLIAKLHCFHFREPLQT